MSTCGVNKVELDSIDHLTDLLRLTEGAMRTRYPGICSHEVHGWMFDGRRFRTIDSAERTVDSASVSDRILLARKLPKILASLEEETTDWRESLHEAHRTVGQVLMQLGFGENDDD